MAAFNGCTSLASVTIPSQVTEIGLRAFGYNGYDKINDFKIYGYSSTAAEKYAKENGFEFIDLETAGHIHTFGEWCIMTESSCVSEGVEKRVCSTCGEVETRKIEKSEHMFEEWVITKRATVIDFGEAKRVCKICGFEEKKILEKLVAEEATDERTGISVIYSADNYENAVEIQVTETIEGEAYDILNSEKGNYKKSLFDIVTLCDGVMAQPSGSVWVRIPIPKGYDPDTTVVYYVTTDGKLERLESRVEDGYVIFETDHFSFYAIVDEGSEINPSINCKCACHKKSIAKLFFKIGLIFQKIFKKNRICKCGVWHY